MAEWFKAPDLGSGGDSGEGAPPWVRTPPPPPTSPSRLLCPIVCGLPVARSASVPQARASSLALRLHAVLVLRPWDRAGQVGLGRAQPAHRSGQAASESRRPPHWDRMEACGIVSPRFKREGRSPESQPLPGFKTEQYHAVNRAWRALWRLGVLAALVSGVAALAVTLHPTMQ